MKVLMTSLVLFVAVGVIGCSKATHTKAPLLHEVKKPVVTAPAEQKSDLAKPAAPAAAKQDSAAAKQDPAADKQTTSATEKKSDTSPLKSTASVTKPLDPGTKPPAAK